MQYLFCLFCLYLSRFSIYKYSLLEPHMWAAYVEENKHDWWLTSINYKNIYILDSIYIMDSICIMDYI